MADDSTSRIGAHNLIGTLALFTTEIILFLFLFHFLSSRFPLSFNHLLRSEVMNTSSMEPISPVGKGLTLTGRGNTMTSNKTLLTEVAWDQDMESAVSTPARIEVSERWIWTLKLRSLCSRA